MKKTCPKCGKVKPLEEFYYIPSSGQYMAWCKDCDNARKKQYYLDNKAHLDAKHKEWQDSHYDEHMEHVRVYNDKKKQARKLKSRKKVLAGLE